MFKYIAWLFLLFIGCFAIAQPSSPSIQLNPRTKPIGLQAFPYFSSQWIAEAEARETISLRKLIAQELLKQRLYQEPPTACQTQDESFQEAPPDSIHTTTVAPDLGRIEVAQELLEKSENLKNNPKLPSQFFKRIRDEIVRQKVIQNQLGLVADFDLSVWTFFGANERGNWRAENPAKFGAKNAKMTLAYPTKNRGMPLVHNTEPVSKKNAPVNVAQVFLGDATKSYIVQVVTARPRGKAVLHNLGEWSLEPQSNEVQAHWFFYLTQPGEGFNQGGNPVFYGAALPIKEAGKKLSYLAEKQESTTRQVLNAVMDHPH